MHYFSDILQGETLIQLQVNLENSKLHHKRVISPNNFKSSHFNLKTILAKRYLNDGNCSPLFRYLSRRVTVA